MDFEEALACLHEGAFLLACTLGPDTRLIKYIW